MLRNHKVLESQRADSTGTQQPLLHAGNSTGPSELALIHPAEELDKGDMMGSCIYSVLFLFQNSHDPWQSLKYI